MATDIAIVGMACCYPDAPSPVELWENSLAQRRAFRRFPAERLSLAQYTSADQQAPDYTYATDAAVIEGYEFDRVKFRVAGSTYRSADLAHWLALDVADQALADAGFGDGQGLPRDSTGVLLGNTLTGEFSRANTMRLRWPYVRQAVEAALTQFQHPSAQRRDFLEWLETQYKSPFPEVGEETLAGNLSNTIAGRICNYFDLHGGGYTIDGACSSSLLAVAQACSALAAGDLQVALAGGVDLSLDPLELVGFAKVGALAPEDMRVYDCRSNGFWPGEGCGMVVLMPIEAAVDQQRHVYAVIRGWGISSDGGGGITRPEVAGQQLAILRAYRRAGFRPAMVPYFEGHGTGTSIGDRVELQVLSEVRQHDPTRLPAVVSSIKANIGHTKAASGSAGLIKAAMALQRQILPPHTYCDRPHPLLADQTNGLKVLRQGQLWPETYPLRAGVSAMGFGGINVHLALEAPVTERRQPLTALEKKMGATPQDAEIFFLRGADAPTISSQIARLRSIAPRLSRAELTDLAAHLATDLQPGPFRAAAVADSPAALEQALQTLQACLEQGEHQRIDSNNGIFLSQSQSPPRLGFLFPGQGTSVPLEGGLWQRRYPSIQRLYDQAQLPIGANQIATDVAQPAILTASMAGLEVLTSLGITAAVTIGHSLGELTALHWAGVFTGANVLALARVRGQAMAQLGDSTGTMASLQASLPEVEALIHSAPVSIAGINSPQQTVISGQAQAVEAVVQQAQARGVKATQLAVSHGFHSPLVKAAVEPLAKYLETMEILPPQRPVISTVTGTALTPDTDLRSMLCQQVTAPVQFMGAIWQALPDVDLWVEVGPGHTLGNLARACGPTPAVSMDVGPNSIRGLLHTVGASFAMGIPIAATALFADRFVRPFNLDWQPKFFANPCETLSSAVVRSELIGSELNGMNPKTVAEPSGQKAQSFPNDGVNLPTEKPLVATTSAACSDSTPNRAVSGSCSALEQVRQLVAERAELPLAAIQDHHRLLSDLHLNSITVGQLVADAAHHLALPVPMALMDYADTTVAELAQALEAITSTEAAPGGEPPELIQGIEAWIRPFLPDSVKAPLRSSHSSTHPGYWRVIASPADPVATLLKTQLPQGEPKDGVVVVLPPQLDETTIDYLLEASRLVLNLPASRRFVLIQQGMTAASFARTLHLEHADIDTWVLTVPPAHPQIGQWFLQEVQHGTGGYTEAEYDAAGTRWQPVLRAKTLQPEARDMPLGKDDLLLVTGGGKGITAECALGLAQKTGAKLAIIGRSDRRTDPELAKNLQRMAAAGVQVRYLAVDVAAAEAVRSAVQSLETDWGPVTAILHGAGINQPQPLQTLDAEAFHRTLAPKWQGAKTLLAAVNPTRLRWFITFSSIIARTGLPGEAHYGLANEWLTQLTQRFQQQHPQCRCLAIEWSLWSEVGMGARLGSVDALLRRGITPISPDQGITILHQLMMAPVEQTAAVITGRLGAIPTVNLMEPALPLWRFLEEPRVFYPGIELIVDVNLSTATDPYLNDHKVQGEPVLPAVIGLEAMAQVAMALNDTTTLPRFESVEFYRPIVVPETSCLTLRIAALANDSGKVTVALRSQQTNYRIDHFRATCNFTGDPLTLANLPQYAPNPQNWPTATVALDPSQDLYGPILFQSGRFQQLQGYRYLSATRCCAEVAVVPIQGWFSQYLPDTLIMGSPATRDATIHALQACIPQTTLVPVGVESLWVNPKLTTGTCLVYGQERSHTHNQFTYDVLVINREGELQEYWHGLQLQSIDRKTPSQAWPLGLLEPYLQRHFERLIPDHTVPLSLAIDQTSCQDRQNRSDRAIRKALGAEISIHRRPDGKPEVDDQRAVSVSHAQGVTLAMAGRAPLACDLELVTPRPESTWRDLLGTNHYGLVDTLATVGNRTTNIAATHIWTAFECLKKAGFPTTSPLTLLDINPEGTIRLASGSLIILSLEISLEAFDNPFICSILVKETHESLRIPTLSQF